MSKENLPTSEERIFKNIDPEKYEDTQKYFHNKSKKVKETFEKIIDEIENKRFQRDNIYGEYMLFDMNNIFEGTSVKDPEKRSDILSKCSSSIGHLGYSIDSESNNIPETFKIRPKLKEE